MGIGISAFVLLIILAAGKHDHVSAMMDDMDDHHQGLLIGKLNVYHHSVGGQVFAINETTLLIKNFNYDGLGKDAYFWGGSDGPPSPQGFIIPDQRGTTNILEKYDNEDVLLVLPEERKIDQLRWLAVFDLSKLISFGDVYIPDDFQPPRPYNVGPMTIRSDYVDCQNVIVKDTKTFVLEQFRLDAADDEEIYFWVGQGHTPNSRGHTVVADENGYLDPLRSYNNEDVTLILPGDLTLDKIEWFSVYDLKNDKPLAYISGLTTDFNVPPYLGDIARPDYSLPNCEQLHNDMQISWDVSGQTVVFEMIGKMDENEWIGFGVGEQMIGSDVAIGYLKHGQGNVYDININDKLTCTTVLQTQPRGVCRDTLLGYSDSIQYLESRRNNGVSSFKYRRQIGKSEAPDRDWNTTSVIYSIGSLINGDDFGMHRIWGNKIFNLSHSSNGVECRPFLLGNTNTVPPWAPVKIVDGKLRSFNAKLGPNGGKLNGYEGITGLASPGLSWYIQQFIAPELFMQRGLTYSFKVEGGNNPNSIYHPFVISTGPTANTSVILAGVETTRRGQQRPTSSGRLCIWQHTKYSRKLDSTFPTFAKYRNSLKLKCENGSEPGRLEFTPNSSWPDVVYYGSWTVGNMGWKIHIVDSFSSGGSSINGFSLHYRAIIFLLTTFLTTRLAFVLNNL